MFRYIRDPKSGKRVDVTSYHGRKIINKYLSKSPKISLKSLIEKHNTKIKTMSVFKKLFQDKIGENRNRIRNMFNYRLSDADLDEKCIECIFHIKNGLYTSERKLCNKGWDNDISYCFDQFFNSVMTKVKKLHLRFIHDFPLSLALANLVVDYFVSTLLFQDDNLFYYDEVGDLTKNNKKYIKKKTITKWANFGRSYILPKEYLTLPQVCLKFYTFVIDLRNTFSRQILIGLVDKFQGDMLSPNYSVFIHQVFTYINEIPYNKTKKSFSRIDPLSIYDLEKVDVFNWPKILEILSINEVIDILERVIYGSKIKYHPDGDGVFSLFGKSNVFGDDTKISENYGCNCICHSIIFITLMESTGYPRQLIYSNLQYSHWGASCRDIASDLVNNYSEISERGNIKRFNLVTDKEGVFYNYTSGIRNFSELMDIDNIYIPVYYKRLLDEISKLTGSDMISPYNKKNFF